MNWYGLVVLPVAKKERKAGTAEKWKSGGLGPASLFQAFIQWREAIENYGAC